MAIYEAILALSRDPEIREFAHRQMHTEIRHLGVVERLVRVQQRSRVLGLAIAARTQRFPEESPYDYAPFSGKSFEWNDEARESLRGYNKLDLGI